MSYLESSQEVAKRILKRKVWLDWNKNRFKETIEEAANKVKESVNRFSIAEKVAEAKPALIMPEIYFLLATSYKKIKRNENGDFIHNLEEPNGGGASNYYIQFKHNDYFVFKTPEIFSIKSKDSESDVKKIENLKDRFWGNHSRLPNINTTLNVSPTANCQLGLLNNAQSLFNIINPKTDKVWEEFIHKILLACKSQMSKKLLLIDIRQEVAMGAKKLFTEDEIVSYTPYGSTNGSNMVIMIINLQKLWDSVG